MISTGNFPSPPTLISSNPKYIGAIWQDLQTYIDKLHSDADACANIGRTATSEAKGKVFAALAETYRRLASDLERIAAANLVLDEERDKHLLGLLDSMGDAQPDDRFSKAAATHE